MPYQEILSRAWAVFKKQRALWLFGILTACSGGTYGRLHLPSFNFNFREFNFQSLRAQSPGHTPPLPPQIEHLFRQIERMPLETWLFIFLGMLLLGLVWGVIIMLLRSFAEPALIRGILEAIDNDRPLTPGEIARAGKPFFSRMLLFHLLVGGSGFILLMVFLGALGLILISTLGLGLICLLPLMFLFVPLVWLLELYLILATMALVIEDLDVITALQRGWQIFKQNFWAAVIMGMLLTFVHLLVSFLIGIFIVAIIFPMVTISIIVTTVSNSITPFLLLGAFSVGFAILLSLAGLGLLQTYLESAWVLAYRHFINQPLEPDTPALPAQGTP